MMTYALKLSDYSLLNIDKETADTLAEYQRYLQEYVGPMARVFIKETILYLSKEGVFSGDQLQDAVDLLSEKIEDQEGLKGFWARFGKLE